MLKIKFDGKTYTEDAWRACLEHAMRIYGFDASLQFKLNSENNIVYVLRIAGWKSYECSYPWDAIFQYLHAQPGVEIEVTK